VGATGGVTIHGLDGIPEVEPGADLAGLIADAAEASGLGLRGGDILVVTHKVVAKAEGRLVDLRQIEPSPLAAHFAAEFAKDPRQVEVVLRETRRVVRMARGVLISETRHGFVCANAGVDASNVPGEGMVCLLPEDPDASARGLRAALAERRGVDVAVVISDTFGRPWRNGLVNVAIGAAGMDPFADYRGDVDPSGYTLIVTRMAVADELAAAAELVMNKTDMRPVALIRGYEYRPPQPGAESGRDLVMDPERDLFR
jgi:coenzyme F420-0:L-glutamate ligase / coenzyme F420-1:gamma-L-glutamate ligase